MALDNGCIEAIVVWKQMATDCDDMGEKSGADDELGEKEQVDVIQGELEDVAQILEELRNGDEGDRERRERGRE